MLRLLVIISVFSLEVAHAAHHHHCPDHWDCVIDSDTNRWGQDILVGSDNILDTAQECCEMCGETNGCLAWAFLRREEDDFHGCWLKNGVPDQVVDIGCDSGLVPAGVRCDPHFNTLDGRKYSYQGTCWYTMIKDCSTPNSNFEITALFEPREDTGDVIKTRTTGINVTVDGESVILDKTGVADVTGSKKINISDDGTMVTLTFDQKDTRFTIYWKGMHHIFSTSVSGPDYHGKLCGLLGNADGDAHNDFQKPDGTVAHDVIEFGDSWKVQGIKCE